jgi:hypothetical protein
MLVVVQFVFQNRSGTAAISLREDFIELRIAAETCRKHGFGKVLLVLLPVFLEKSGQPQ